jgi:hypothetical protein
LAVGHQRLGAFSFRNAWESESNFETSFWAPAEFARQQVRQ